MLLPTPTTALLIVTCFDRGLLTHEFVLGPCFSLTSPWGSNLQTSNHYKAKATWQFSHTCDTFAGTFLHHPSYHHNNLGHHWPLFLCGRLWWLSSQWSFVVMAFFSDPILAEGLPMWRETMPCSSLHLLDRVRLHKPRERATCVKSQMITKNWGTEPEKLEKKPHKSAL